MTQTPKKLSYYEYGATTLYACQYDQRFSYCAYIPKNYDENGSSTYNLAVIVHGTDRPAQQYRDAFIHFAEATNTIILAPLFPGGITEPSDLDSYKFIKFGGIHYDHILLAMVEEITGKYRIASNKFLLHGFSGGGHFAHRFFYFHPDRLLGVSIGAPGIITYLDTTKPWYVGVGDMEQQFGMSLQLEQMRRVPVQMVIGGEDVDTWEINVKDSPLWMDGLDAFGQTRLERLRALRDNYEREGISVRYDEVPQVAHEGFKILEPVKEFFSIILQVR